MSTLFEKNKTITSKYVHATSKGHEAFQIALGQQLKSYDYVFPYYRDDALLLAMGFSPKQLMLQLLAKKTTLFQEVELIMLILVLNTLTSKDSSSIFCNWNASYTGYWRSHGTRL